MYLKKNVAFICVKLVKNHILFGVRSRCASRFRPLIFYFGSSNMVYMSLHHPKHESLQCPISFLYIFPIFLKYDEVLFRSCDLDHWSCDIIFWK